jgi:hypothetical protein
MTSYIEIDGRRYPITSAALELYHCSSSEADFNLELAAPHTLWLAGTVTPAPQRASELVGARLRLDPRSIDEVFETLLGTPITTYPNGLNVCEAFLDVEPALGDHVRLVASFPFDWDRALDPPGASVPATRRAMLDLVATVRGVHLGTVPR